MQPILEIENLSVSFFTRAGEVPAVTRFSATVTDGETMGFVGESGCGKSTVALAILGGLGPNGRITGGSIRFRGRDLVGLSDRQLRRFRGKEIAMVYQEPMASLNPAMKIGKQLMEVPILHERASGGEARRRSLEMLEAVRLADPERLLGSYPHQLSGGQQQRVVIAMALLARPALLLLDEPTTALDVTVEAGIVDLVQDLRRRFGMSMLFISHNLGLIGQICDRVTVMYAGEAVEHGTTADLFRRMRHPYTQGLFQAVPRPESGKQHPLVAIPGQPPSPLALPPGCRFGPRCRHFRAGICDVDKIPMLAMPGTDGHFSRCVRVAEIDWTATPQLAPPPEAPAPGRQLLRAEGVRKYHELATGSLFRRQKRKVKAVESVDLAVHAGETLAIVGESGCGKSTLARLLLGLDTVTDGVIELDGHEIGDVPVEARDRATIAAIQMVFQNPADTLNPSYSVGAQLTRALERFGIGGSTTERRRRMHALLDEVKLSPEFARRIPRQLSGGQKQRIGIARAFAGEAGIIVADEPVSALDVSVQAAMIELLKEIQRRSHTALLFISHDLGVVRHIADRVLVMYLGHIVEQGSTAQIFAPPWHPYTEALLSAIPSLEPDEPRQRIVLEGELPSALAPPPGCPFQTRCRYKHLVPGNLCETVVPPQRPLADGHFSKCHLGGVGADEDETPA